MLNGFLYVATLFFTFGYFYTTKFTSKFVYYMFFGTLLARPAFIILYSLFVFAIEHLRQKSKASKPWKTGQSQEWGSDQSHEYENEREINTPYKIDNEPDQASTALKDNTGLIKEISKTIVKSLKKKTEVKKV